MRHALLALLLAGCYHPSIQSGDFTCSATEPLCPSGFQCANGFCVRPGEGGPDLGVSGPFFGLAPSGDLDLSGLSDEPIKVVVDTLSGSFQLPAGLGPDGGVLQAASFQRVTQTAGNGASGAVPVALFSFEHVNIPANVTLSSSQSTVFALAASESMIIDGKLEWTGLGGLRAAAGKAGGDAGLGLPGPGAAGDANTTKGGGGASHASAGTAGSPDGGKAGQVYGTDSLLPVVPGCGGGSGGLQGGFGGAGGGALLLFAKDLTVHGSVLARGIAGGDATGPGGGGGGGSGGSILVSAGHLTLGAKHAFGAAGGAGGAGRDDASNAVNPSGGNGGAGRIDLLTDQPVSFEPGVSAVQADTAVSLSTQNATLQGNPFSL